MTARERRKRLAAAAVRAGEATPAEARRLVDPQPARPPGRPPEGPGGETRDKVVRLRLTRQEREAWQRLADSREVELSELVRETMAVEIARG